MISGYDTFLNRRKERELSVDMERDGKEERAAGSSPFSLGKGGNVIMTLFMKESKIIESLQQNYAISF
jgi:hypothetical protein